MRTRPFLWSALLCIVLAISGCAKDDIQKSSGDDNGVTRAVNPVFSLEQAKAYVTEQGNDIFAANLGMQSTLTPLYPIWNSAQPFELEGADGYYVSLAGNLNVLLEAFGGTACSDACGHNHGIAGESETTGVSTLFLKKNPETGAITAYVQTNIRTGENIYYALYSTLKGDILSGNQSIDGQISSPNASLLIADPPPPPGYGEWCEICSIFITPGSPLQHTRCHGCWSFLASCTCPGGGGTDPENACPLCSAIGDPRCSTPADSCLGDRCRICKNPFYDWFFWNVRLHQRMQCAQEEMCNCRCQICGYHPDYCQCCDKCHQYPCVCINEDSINGYVYTPPVYLHELHITVPKADIRIAFNELHTH